MAFLFMFSVVIRTPRSMVAWHFIVNPEKDVNDSSPDPLLIIAQVGWLVCFWCTHFHNLAPLNNSTPLITSVVVFSMV